MQSTLSAEVTAAIRAELGRQNRNQSDLARAMHKPQQWVNSRLNDKRKLSVDDLDGIAAALDIPMASLLPSDKASA